MVHNFGFILILENIAHNKKINLTGTAIDEFDFWVLAMRFLKY
jgi:hypothetical protein